MHDPAAEDAAFFLLRPPSPAGRTRVRLAELQQRIKDALQHIDYSFLLASEHHKAIETPFTLSWRHRTAHCTIESLLAAIPEEHIYETLAKLVAVLGSIVIRFKLDPALIQNLLNPDYPVGHAMRHLGTSLGYHQFGKWFLEILPWTHPALMPAQHPPPDFIYPLILYGGSQGWECHQLPLPKPCRKAINRILEKDAQPRAYADTHFGHHQFDQAVLVTVLVKWSIIHPETPRDLLQLIPAHILDEDVTGVAQDTRLRNFAKRHPACSSWRSLLSLTPKEFYAMDRVGVGTRRQIPKEALGRCEHFIEQCRARFRPLWPAIKSSIASLDYHMYAKNIARARFGFNTTQPPTLDQLGYSLGLTRARIQQIEAKARAQLRLHAPWWDAVVHELQALIDCSHSGAITLADIAQHDWLCDLLRFKAPSRLLAQFDQLRIHPETLAITRNHKP